MSIEDEMPDEIKIVVMSDTHLDRPTDEFISICSRFCEDADMVIHLGDWDKVGILNYLERYPLEAVAGNMDDHSIKQRLPARNVVKAGPFRLALTHGWGARDGIRQRIGEQFSGVDAVLFGHTHQPLIARENGILWFNPGSVFLGRGNARKSIGLLKIKDRIEGEIIEV
jgi:putative phosphoesterase